MTFKEAVRQKVRRIRLPVWEPSAYVELPILANGIGPVARVHDVSGDVNVGMWNFDNDTSQEWEPFIDDAGVITTDGTST